MKKCYAILYLAFLPLLTLISIHTVSDMMPEQRETKISTAQKIEEISVPEQRYLAITFDDGPHDKTTERLLDGLAERGIHATFFLIGEEIAGREDLVKRMQQEGHQIGNHTFRHTRMDDPSSDTVLREIAATNRVLQEITGEDTFWIRPPWGFINASNAALMTVPLIGWSVDPEDWRLQDAEAVFDHLIQNAKDGDILLLHDIYESSVDAALRSIDTLLQKGYQFVTVEELFQKKGISPKNGTFYKHARDE